MTQGIDFGALMQQMGQQLEVIPIGDYDVVVKSAEARTTNDGSKPQLRVKFAVENGPQAGRTLWNSFTLSQENPNALLIFFTQMKALGLGPEFWSQPGITMEHAAQALLNRRARVNVGHRPYQGNMQPDIKRINPPLGGAMGGVAPGPGVPAPVAPGGLGGPAPMAPSPMAPAPVAPVAPVAAPAPVVTQAPPPAPVAPQVQAPAPQPVQPEVVQQTAQAAAATGNVPGTEQVTSPVPPAPAAPPAPEPQVPAPSEPSAPAEAPQPQQSVVPPAPAAPAAPEVAQAPVAAPQPQAPVQPQYQAPVPQAAPPAPGAPPPVPF